MIRYGIIGAGRIGNNHAGQIKLLANAAVVAVYDIRPEAAADFREKFGARICASAAELAASPDVDCVIVSSPTYCHREGVEAAGMPDGEYTLGAMPVIVENRRARLKTGEIAGSTLAFFEGLRNVVQWTGRPLAELVRATAWNQAESLGIPGIGKLETGFRANLVRLSEDCTPRTVWIDGVRKWNREEAECAVN
ncbi:Gfo/Idh/MocA family oxidoreductase [Victivallis vadensis]|uniref:Gfo/Idh/MocA family oxidoreductase n=1 Tax=Victivallis vadensis TaxID=172901 RepID=UPI00307F6166